MDKKFVGYENIAVVILAAGLSERMGKPKYSLRFDEHTSFLEKIINDYKKFGCGQIIVVMNTEGIRSKLAQKIIEENIAVFVENSNPDKGRFLSVKLGVNLIKGETPVFIHNVDNPFIDNNILDILINQIKPFSYCVPMYNDRGGHPVLISSEIKLAFLEIKNNKTILKNALADFNRINVEIKDERVLRNINTSEDYLRWFG